MYTIIILLTLVQINFRFIDPRQPELINIYCTLLKSGFENMFWPIG